MTDKPRIKLTSISLGQMLYHEPLIGQNNYLSQSFNAQLLSKPPRVLSAIQALVSDAENQCSLAKNTPVLLESRYYYLLALKSLDEAISELLILITHQHHLHGPSDIKIVPSLMTDTEFNYMDQLQTYRTELIQNLVEIILCIIETQVRNELWYSTDYFFDEINSFGHHTDIDERIKLLKKLIRQKKKEL